MSSPQILLALLLLLTLLLQAALPSLRVLIVVSGAALSCLLITLLGEATFHQVHGGAITNHPAAELPQRLQTYGEEYRQIRGFYHENPTRPPLLFGHARPEIIPWLHRGCDVEMRSRNQAVLVPQP